MKLPKINKKKIEKEMYFVKCQKCHKEISGRTEREVLSNSQQHWKANHIDKEICKCGHHSKDHSYIPDEIKDNNHKKKNKLEKAERR